MKGLPVFALVLVVLFCALRLFAHGDELPSVMQETGIVTEVVDGDTIRLDTGVTVDLMGCEDGGTVAGKRWLEIYVLDRRVCLKRVHRLGFGRVRAVPVLWENTDVCGLMLATGHCRLRLVGQEPTVYVTRWTEYETRARRLRLGLWAREVVKKALPPYGGTIVLPSTGW